jgi:hypothetical protein
MHGDSLFLSCARRRHWTVTPCTAGLLRSLRRHARVTRPIEWTGERCVPWASRGL